MMQNNNTLDNRVLVEIIDCSGSQEVAPLIVGSDNYSDILTAKLTDF